MYSSPRNYFHEQFQPKKALLDKLPWALEAPPTIVVHLREGDSFRDHRAGLDDTTLSLLAQEKFPSQDGIVSHDDPIFLVTNRVDWYSKFPHWVHPEWSVVQHSALGIAWDNQPYLRRSTRKSDEEGLLEMWADWYTLLNAKYIYHTHSDFSLSAARWNEEIESWTIKGTTTDALTVGSNESKLLLIRDFDDPEEKKMPRLVDRVAEELKYCDPSNTAHKTKADQERMMQQLAALMKARPKQVAKSSDDDERNDDDE
jgi:hypothetical protein